MRITRKGFIAALFSPFVAKVLPEQKISPRSAFDLFDAARTNLNSAPPPNPGLFGLKYYQSRADTGNYLGIPRAAFGEGEPRTATRAKMQFDSEEWQRGVVGEYHRYLRSMRPPGSFQRYMEAERAIHA